MDKNTKMIHKTQYRKDLATRIQLKITGDLRCSIRLIRSCSNSGIRCGSLVKNQVIRDDRAKKGSIVTTTNGTYPWPSLTQVFRGISDTSVPWHL